MRDRASTFSSFDQFHSKPEVYGAVLAVGQFGSFQANKIRAVTKLWQVVNYCRN